MTQLKIGVLLALFVAALIGLCVWMNNRPTSEDALRKEHEALKIKHEAHLKATHEMAEILVDVGKRLDKLENKK